MFTQIAINKKSKKQGPDHTVWWFALARVQRRNRNRPSRRM